MTSSAEGPTAAIVFVGPMGAGKTSIGKRVAKALGRTFTDTDRSVVAAHGPIPAIFEAHGEVRFREFERDAVIEALKSGGVVALGGGAVMDAATRADLAAHRVVLLTVEPRVVSARIRDSGRPLLDGGDAMAQWSRIAAERAPLYAEVADVSFDTSSGPLSAVSDAIVAWVCAGEEVEQEA